MDMSKPHFPVSMRLCVTFLHLYKFTSFGHSASRLSAGLSPPQSSLLSGEGKDGSWMLVNSSDIVWETTLLYRWLQFPLLLENINDLLMLETEFLNILLEYKLLLIYKETTRFNKDLFGGARIEHCPPIFIVLCVRC